MPNDSGLRKCQCGNYFLQSEAVKLEIPAGDEREFAPHVHTSDLKHAIVNAEKNTALTETQRMLKQMPIGKMNGDEQILMIALSSKS